MNAVSDTGRRRTRDPLICSLVPLQTTVTDCPDRGRYSVNGYRADIPCMNTQAIALIPALITPSITAHQGEYPCTLRLDRYALSLDL